MQTIKLQQKGNKLSTRDLTTLSLLIALNVVCARMLSFQVTESIKISSTFIVIAITGALYGPLYGGIAAATADIVGIILFPSPFGVFLCFLSIYNFFIPLLSVCLSIFPCQSLSVYVSMYIYLFI